MTNMMRGLVQTCPQCTEQTQSWVDFCPGCGARISIPSRIRVLGWVMIVIGTGLTVGTAYLLFVIHRIIQGSGDPDATTRFTGTPGQALFVYGILGLVLVFGVVAVTGGVWQARYGTRNPRLVKIVLFFWMAFLGIGAAVSLLT